ncbi:hypothetical protein AB0B09_42145, partial [Streptomyces sp. NPDC044948]
PAATGGQLFLLAEGAMVTAGVTGGTEPAGQARAAARVLLGAAGVGSSAGAGAGAGTSAGVSPPAPTR